MRRIRVAILLAPLMIVAGAGIGLAIAWGRNRRLGSDTMNRLVNPMLLRRGIAGTGRIEVGILEHVGRSSGTRRLTPVHPVPTADGFRIPAPLGLKSQWAQNVLAAGHCRVQLHDVVFDLDEPRLLPASAIPEVTGPSRLVGGRVGIMYLVLHTFNQHAGALEPVEAAVSATAEPEPAAGAPVAASTPVAAG